MDDARLARIGRLAAVARGLEREGIYNGAKLLRAAMTAELTRLAEAEAASGADPVAAAVEALAAEAAGLGYPEALVERLPAIAAAARAQAPLPLEAAPPARTCRACGELFVTEHPPATCPRCEAPAFSFREEPPVWFLEPAEPGPILASLAAGGARIVGLLGGRDDAALDRPPAPGEWSARQTLAHLVTAERLFATRVQRILDEDEPSLVAVAAWSDEATAGTDAPASELAQDIHDLRGRTLERLHELDAAGWGRGGHHPEWGRVTLLAQAGYFARHETSHHAQLAAAAQGRLPGH